MDAADVLEEAAEALERFGWVQGCYGSRDSGMCSIGAIRFVTEQEMFTAGITETLAQWDEATAALARVAGTVPSLIPRWNDKAGQTKENVIDTFKLAAKDLRNQA